MRLLLVLTSLLLTTPASAATVGDLFDGLEALVPTVAKSADTRFDWDALQTRYDLPDHAYDDYVRVKIAFEATRAGGFWATHWAITDQQPQSDRVWADWEAAKSLGPLSSTAECDELSALFATVARALGVEDVGLFWPTRNHTVAVWSLESRTYAPVRIVVPTSQIFLHPEATLGTDGFDPWTQKTIYDYTRADVDRARPLDDGFLAELLARVEVYAPASAYVLQAMRNLRELRQNKRISAQAAAGYLDSRLILTTATERAAIDAFRAELAR